jgi:pimeloyl-ACP methyl ester carboxylesterase
MSETDVAVVLAHGGWADGSSWSKVIAGLRSERVKAVAVPLPLTSLADDVAALDQMLERVEGPVVVAGNAYAGAVIASTSDEKVASLVYVAALAPDAGETVGDIFYRAEPHPLGPRARSRSPRADLVARGGVRQGFRPARLDAGAGAAGRHSAAARRGLHRCPVPRPAWKDRPSWFLVAEEDRMIPAETQPFMAERMKARVRTAPADHMPMLTAPPAVVDIVLEAVREVQSRRWPLR